MSLEITLSKLLPRLLDIGLGNGLLPDAPIYYPNQYWLLFNDVWWYSRSGNYSESNHFDQVTLFGDIDLGLNTDSGNGLLSYGTKPLPEPILAHHQ